MSQTKHRVLLTGANGFIGNHILAQLLSAGFSVRAIVRSQPKADSLLQTHSCAGHNLDFSIVPDITANDAFTEAYQSEDPVDTVIHTASPFLYREVNNNHDLLDPAIKGTMEILKGAKNVPSIKRVIILSSIAAIMDYSEASPPGGRLWTDRDWNPVTWEEANQAEDYPTVYRVSKTFSEKAAWEFMKEQKPHFDLVSLNPPMAYGPILHSISELSQLNESNLRIWDLFINSSKGAELPPNGVYSYVDVRDLALAHVRAVLKPEVGNKRVIVSAGSVTSREIADILRSEIPALAGRTPVGNLGENTLPINPYLVDIGPARDILGLGFLSKKATFVDLAGQLLEIEKGNTGH